MGKTPVLILGFGKMGQIYLKTLKELGVLEENILVVDKAPDKLKVLPPAIRIFTSLDKALAHGPGTAFVLTNTNFHAEHIGCLLKARVNNIFTEKPVVFRSEEAAYIASAMSPESKVYTAYLLNFSLAVRSLMDFMNERKLVLREMRGVWGKNRSFDTRMTAGDLEDEMTHMVALALMLARKEADIGEIIVSAKLSFLPYASPGAQTAGHAIDVSVPLYPNSSASVTMSLYPNPQKSSFVTQCFLMSSYLSPLQTRMIDIVLGSDSSDDITHVGRILFDVGGEEHLFLQETGAQNGEIQERVFPADGKVRDEVAAFLAVARGGNANPLLTGFADAVRYVRFAEACVKSDREASVVTVPL